MSTQKIDGEYQIEPGTIVDASIASAAAISSTKLAPWSANRNANNFQIDNLSAPTGATQAATKAYVDATAAGLSFKDPARVASTTNVAGTYTATGGASGRGQLTAMPNTLDGVSLAANDRILLKNQTSGAQNGIWVVSTLGTGSNGVWDRATDFDTDSEVRAGVMAHVSEGTVNADTWWFLTTNNPVVIGGASGTSLTWSQFQALISAGAGLLQTGNTIDVVAGDASLLVSADNLIVQRSGTTLATDGFGLRVADAGITPTQLATGVAGAGLNGGAGTALSVDARQEEFVGNGSTTAYVLAAAPIVASLNVFVRGVRQKNTVDYNVSGSTVTFTTAPRNNWEIGFQYLAQ